MAEGWRETFASRGFAGPVPVLDRAGCRALLGELRAAPPPLDWAKGHAASSEAYFAAAASPAIVDRVVALLGDDVMLWGASLVRRRPGQVHPWHTDVESGAAQRSTVSVWVGLENTSCRSSLRVVAGSHRFGVPLQEMCHRAGVDRRAETSQVEAWARLHDPHSRLEQPALADGEALFFDGRLWHGSHNGDPERTRTALLLQYATPDTPIRIPDFAAVAWPFRFHTAPEPPCIMIHGSGAEAQNRIVPPPRPQRAGSTVLTCVARRLALPLAEDRERGWKPHRQFSGTTPCVRRIGCHVSVLCPGHSPHPPHHHAEEELLVVLDGEAELLLADAAGGPVTPRRLAAGSFVYYPAWRFHTLRNASSRPVTYLMLKWIAGEPKTGGEPLATVFCDDDGWEKPDGGADGNAGWVRRRLLRGRTRWLRKLASHVSVLAPGAGYAPHTDAHDVAILVRSGELESMGRRLAPHDVVYYAAGEPHDMRNVGRSPASYLVFELHGARREDGAKPAPPRSWKGRLVRRLPPPLQALAHRAWALLHGRARPFRSTARGAPSGSHPRR